MPITITAKKWKDDTAVFAHSRSTALKQVDAALAAYHNPANTAPLLVKTQALQTAFDQWKTSKGSATEWTTSIRNKTGIAATLDREIRAELARLTVRPAAAAPPPPTASAPISAPVVPVEPGSFHQAEMEAKAAWAWAMFTPRPSTGPGDVFEMAHGYRVYTDPRRTNLAPSDGAYKNWTHYEVSLLNNAVKDSRAALTAAVSDLEHIDAAGRTRYARFFGTYSDANRDFVLKNFKSIQRVLNVDPAPPPVALAPGANSVARMRARFEQPAAPAAPVVPTPTALPAGLAIIDATNDGEDFWRNVFGFTSRNRAPGGAVPFYVGRAFFNRNTTIAASTVGVDLRRALSTEARVRGDATVVTLLHELAHACFFASDLPTVASGKVLDADGMPPDNNTPCADQATDVALAAAWPGWQC